ncbi:MAG: hypothetical protein HZB67_04650 [Candidatus Aenigmarchaeota archaeon]|nr:hypothetical protein [Candidatus Aenigmarchaeota archaeon]
MPYKFKRSPAAHAKIGDIRPEENERVRLVGRIRKKSQGRFVLEDECLFADIIMRNEIEFEEGDFIRVLAKVVPTAEGYELHAELVQDMKKLDIVLYKKVMLKEN